MMLRKLLCCNKPSRTASSDQGAHLNNSPPPGTAVSTAQDSNNSPAQPATSGSTSQNSNSPAHDELERLCSSVLQVLDKAPDEQYAELKQKNVLQQLTEALDALERQDKPSTASKQAGKAADKLRSWEPVVSGVDKLAAALAKFEVAGKKLVELAGREAGQQLATALSSTAYVGPIFGLLAFALKQCSIFAKVPADAVVLLRSCRDLLADIHTAWPHLVGSPEAKQRLEAAIADTAKLINEAIGIRQDSVFWRFLDAQANKEDLAKAAEKLKDKRASLMTLLLLQLQPAPVVRQPLAGDQVFGFQQQESDLAAQLLLPGPQVLWLHGMGGCGKSTMACQLYNRLMFGVPEANLPGFGCSAFLELEGGETQAQLQPLLLQALKQLGATGFNERASAGELNTALLQFAQQNRCLLVVDNVWTADQLDLLLPRELHAGSRVIIASRQESMSDSAAWQDIKRRQLLLRAQVQPVDEAAAQQLFSHRTGMDCEALPQQLQQVQADVIAACGRLPLALRVAGGLLYEQTDVTVWQEVLVLLREGAAIPNADTDARLRGAVTKSFDALTIVAQSMFLDAVCVLHGTHWCNEELALGIWSSLHSTGAVRLAWQELQRRSLITLEAVHHAYTPFNTFHIHDVIKALGRGIVTRDARFYGSRVWVRLDGDVVQFQGTIQLQPLEAACLTGTADGPAAWDQLTQHNMAHLRIFMACNCNLYRSTLQLQQLSALTCMRALNLSRNSLSGELPVQLSALTNLQALDLSRNYLNGQLPEQWSALTNLQALDLSSNQLSGQLPEQWSALVKLQKLYLSRNQLSGQLPEQWSALTNLQQLRLRWNALSGQLPQQWSALTNLQWLDLRNNQLSGQLPQWSALANR